MLAATINQIERIARGFTVDPTTKCWVWQKSLSQGYASVGFNGKGYRGHRLMYLILRGEIPSDLVCDHLCRNKACINPNHIDVVTQKVNLARGIYTKPRGGNLYERTPQTHCKRGHEQTLENTYVRPSSKYRRCQPCKDLYNSKEWRKKYDKPRPQRP